MGGPTGPWTGRRPVPTFTRVFHVYGVSTRLSKDNPFPSLSPLLPLSGVTHERGDRKTYTKVVFFLVPKTWNFYS